MKAKTSAILMSVFLVLTCFCVFTVKGLSHDVAVLLVGPSQSSANPGDPVDIYVFVENEGDYTETFEVIAYYGNGTLSSPEGKWEDFWSMGDVNRDGHINDIDLARIERAYGTHPWDPLWDPDADLNRDLFVDMRDVIIYSKNEGFVVVGTKTVNLPSHDSTWLTYTWDTTGVAPGNYTINAYAISVPEEIDRTDNNLEDYVVTILAPPEYLMAELVETIETWDIPQGTESSLTSKIDAALNLLNMGNENGAMHKMMDFMDQVEAKRGKQLTNEQADYLISEAQKIIDLI